MLEKLILAVTATLALTMLTELNGPSVVLQQNSPQLLAQAPLLLTRWIDRQ